METLFILSILFSFLILVIVISRNSLKKKIRSIEYKEWMHTKNFVHIAIELFDDDVFDYEKTGIVTQTTLTGYVHSGVFNFVLGKKTFSDIEIYPENPDEVDIKKTAPIIINTGAVKAFEEIDV